MNSRTSANKFPWAFFFLVFILSIPLLLISSILGNKLPIPINLPISAFMFIIPLAVALILSYRQRGSNGIKELLKKIFDFKKIKNGIWYAPILLLTPLIYFLSYVIMRLMGLSLPEPKIPFLIAPVLFLVFFIGATCEELGWTGYAIDPMQNQLGASNASIILGIVWQIWHIVPDIQAQNTANWIVWHSLYSVALRIFIVWIYNNTGKSVFAAIVVHAMDNISWSLFPNYGSGYDPFFTCIVAWIIVVVVIFLWNPKTLAQYRYTRLSGSDVKK
ncbi:MAG: CPBP family intramembrane metalloprotease [Chloroflexi bacterium]|nr:CPBP family intramembrane metalloprotease [Chloroflexota bacterium]